MKVVSVGPGEARLNRWASPASVVSIAKSASAAGRAMVDVVAERKRAVTARRDE